MTDKPLPTAMELWTEYKNQVLFDIPITHQAEHVAAAAFWGGVIAGLMLAPIPFGDRQRIEVAMRDHMVRVLACLPQETRQ